MAPVTGTIPKTKVRNNCNVPQEAVTPTRRDMSSNLVSTSLDWVPVSEYNSRSNYNQSRKAPNNTSDQEYVDLDNSNSFESGFGRFVPVRPQPRVLPLNVQHRDSLTADHSDENPGPSSGYSLHAYPQVPNGIGPHSNHAAAAVMIVNPTTPNAVSLNMPQPFNANGNSSRNNLIRNINTARNNFEGSSNNNTTNNNSVSSNSRTAAKTVNLINNMYDTAGSSNNLNETNQVHRESARALGEAIVAACPDAVAVERRLGQIREYIRVTSSLVDTMRNSEDEAFIEHTKEEYDELVQMVMKLKESEDKLEKILTGTEPENKEVVIDEPEYSLTTENMNLTPQEHVVTDNSANSESNSNSLSKKINNFENEQLNKSMHSDKSIDKDMTTTNIVEIDSTSASNIELVTDPMSTDNEVTLQTNPEIEIMEITTMPITDSEHIEKDDSNLNEILRKNIISCTEKLALIEEIKNKDIESIVKDDQDIIVRPVSSQSNGSAYSENELWQNEIKNKMEISQQRLAALKQQQKRLLKYQAEAKQQLAEMNHARQMQEMHAAVSQDSLVGMQNQAFSGNYQHPNRMYAANQIGVATTLPHSGDVNYHQGMGIHQNNSTDFLITNNIEHSDLDTSGPHHEDRYSQRDGNLVNSEETGARESDPDNEEGLCERGHQLTMKLHELRAKKQHMENLVTEFQKLQMPTRAPGSHNTYSSSGDDSADEELTRKCNKIDANIKNDDPFKLLEIKAIKAALQKTKDLMRSVENYEAEHLAEIHEANFQTPNTSNINDNKSEGGGSAGGWSNEGSMSRVRNSLPTRQKFTNAHHSQQQNHELNIASLQELAQQLRVETEKIMDERARLKKAISNKEFTRKQKKVNEEVRPSTSGAVGPVERRQIELRALLAEKQKQLEALLNKEKIICARSEEQKQEADSHPTSVVNQSYNSEQDDPESRPEQVVLIDTQNTPGAENFRVNGDNMYVERSHQNSLPAHVPSNYTSDSDSAMLNKSNQRNRGRRRQPQERQFENSFENMMSPTSNSNQNVSHNEHRGEPSAPNVGTPIPTGDNGSNPSYPNIPQTSWANNKMNQDMRTNQFTQNSHSQTMDRLLGTPQISFPPSMPFNMMMPYGVMGACACGCAMWGAWCWQQLMLQQREVHQLRDQINHLEERWRSEHASHTLNNQVPPGNRANNYWDNFRSYSRQNLLSANSKTNADGHLGIGQAHNPHPLVERSHNALHPAAVHSAATAHPANTPKRNTDAAAASNNAVDEPRQARRNVVAYERSFSFSSAPDVLNVNQNNEHEATSVAAQPVNTRHPEDPNINLNRQEAIFNTFRNVNISDTIPEIVQSHANNLNSASSPLNTKKKSSSKLPAKNSASRRNCSLDYAQASNINIASTSETHNPNLASTSHEFNDKATSKLFDLLRENVYTEVTTLIGVNESHPDFLIQLFKELQLISSDSLRQKVLQSIRGVLSQYSAFSNNQNVENFQTEPNRVESTPAATDNENCQENAIATQNGSLNSVHLDHNIVRFLMSKSDETCTPDVIETLASLVIDNAVEGGQSICSTKRLIQFLSKYEGARLREVSSDIIDNISQIIVANNNFDESSRAPNEASESTMLQDVAGSLSLFNTGDGQMHPHPHPHPCPYELWPAHMHVDMEAEQTGEAAERHRPGQEGTLDLISCAEMHNGELAEADQTCRSEEDEVTDARDEHDASADTLPDLVEAEEATPTEAEAEWLGLDRVPTRLHMEESSENQKGNINRQ